MEPQPKLVRESPWGAVGVQLAAIVAAFILGFFLVLAFGYDPFEVYGVLCDGTIGSIENIAWSLQNTTPLIFTGLAVAIAFQAGLFNIGGEGQLVAGAFAAAVVGWGVPELARTDLLQHPFWARVWYPAGVVIFVTVYLARMRCKTACTRSSQGWIYAIPFVGLFLLAPFIAGPLCRVAQHFLLPAALIAAALGGALWALLPALLRAYLGVSEVINTIMFNFVSALFASYLLTTVTFKDPGAVPQTPAIQPTAELAKLSSYLPAGDLQASVGSTQLNTGFLLAVLTALVVGMLLWRTTIGFELRAVGANATAAATQGIPVPRTLIFAMMLSGAVAGLGGAEQVLGVHHHFVKDFWSGLGFTGIAVALVGRNNPIGVVFAAMLFGALQNGAVEIDMMTLFPRELIQVLQALIIFLVASGPVLKEKLFRRSR